MVDAQMIDRLRFFEDAVVMPLLDELQAGAVRDSDFQFTLMPGAIAFLVNNSDAYERDGDVVRWQPLSVIYCDDADVSGEVFRFEAVHRGDEALLASAEIVGCCRCVYEGEWVEMRNPIDNKRLLRIRVEDAPSFVLNAWYVFRGAILPMLYHREYRFMTSLPDRVRFQSQMMHQIHVAYAGVM